MQAKDTLQKVMTVVALTLHVARVDEGRKKDYLLEMKMRKLGPATVYDLYRLTILFDLQ
jgi:hypothetical protein